MKYKYIGVDLAEEKLDVYVGNKYHHFTNKESGIARFLALVREQGENVLIAYESTGYISRRFASILFDHNIPQRCLNPAWVYYYGKSNGKYAKNDRIDSKTIYQYATEKAIQPDYPYNKFILELREKVAARKLLVRTRAKLKCASRAYNGSSLQRIKNAAFSLTAEISTLEAEIKQSILDNELYGALYKELSKQPGFGKVLAMTLIAYLPELGKVDSKAISAIVGVAPYDDQSGKMKGKRNIQGGRSAIRNELYIAETASMRLKDWELREYYEKLVSTRPHKVALIACCRKHLVRLNAKVRDWYRNGCNGTLPQQGSGEAA